MAKPTPDGRTIRYFRDLGLLAEKVTWYAPRQRRNHDLYGFADVEVIGWEGRPVTYVQATTGSNHSARRKKITSSECTWKARKVLEAGCSIFVMSWSRRGKQGERKTWQSRLEEITLDMLDRE
jgi:hypothetical protein